MFASNALPLPSTFGHEHRPLRLTSEIARPQPQGGCHFDSGQQRSCLCQTYQHNRSAPGNICDCGHSACYHSRQNSGGTLSHDRVISALVEKVRKMEDLIIEERESRDRQISKERRIWEQEMRVLREALAPFFHMEADLTRRLLDLEDKTAQTYEEHSLLKERLAALDKTSTALERYLDGCGLSRCRKRKASLGQDETGVLSPGSSYTCSETSVSDATSATTHKSPQAPSLLRPNLPASIVITSPRSSGILRLRSTAHYSHENSTYINHHKQQLPASNTEPRSSGFLSIDLAERLRNPRLERPQYGKPASSAVHETPRASAFTKISGLPPPPHNEMSTGALPVSALLSKSIGQKVESRSPKKLKQDNGGMTGLELLANVAGPLAQQS